MKNHVLYILSLSLLVASIQATPAFLKPFVDFVSGQYHNLDEATKSYRNQVAQTFTKENAQATFKAAKDVVEKHPLAAKVALIAAPVAITAATVAFFARPLAKVATKVAHSIKRAIR